MLATNSSSNEAFKQQFELQICRNKASMLGPFDVASVLSSSWILRSKVFKSFLEPSSPTACEVPEVQQQDLQAHIIFFFLEFLYKNGGFKGGDGLFCSDFWGMEAWGWKCELETSSMGLGLRLSVVNERKIQDREEKMDEFGPSGSIYTLGQIE